MKADVYRIVADTIIEKLDKGVVPWRKTWKAQDGSSLIPRNFNSKRPYRGINVFLLGMQGYGSPFWATFKGVQKAGGNVRKGEKATVVVFWKILRKSQIDPDTGEAVTKSVPLLRYYRVFNIEQCEGIEVKQAGETPEADPFDPVEHCEDIIAGYDGPSLSHGGNRAYYQPSTDHVQLPKREAFESPEAYYATAFHELVHATGHADRLKRPGITDPIMFANHTYADEELVAEMGAAILCATTGIDSATIENSASYIKHWITKLKEDPKVIVYAGARGQKAADLILGTKFEEQTPERVAVAA